MSSDVKIITGFEPHLEWVKYNKSRLILNKAYFCRLNERGVIYHRWLRYRDTGFPYMEDAVTHICTTSVPRWEYKGQIDQQVSNNKNIDKEKQCKK